MTSDASRKDYLEYYVERAWQYGMIYPQTELIAEDAQALSENRAR
jgi:hypothetical protein